MRTTLLMLAFLGGCGGVDAASRALAGGCTLDGAPVDDCYAASKGGGAVFGVTMTRGTADAPDFVAFYFQASTMSRGASSFPAPNNDLDFTVAKQTFTGSGSATWSDDGSSFCVKTRAIAEAATATTHVACVPSPLMN